MEYADRNKIISYMASTDDSAEFWAGRFNYSINCYTECHDINGIFPLRGGFTVYMMENRVVELECRVALQEDMIESLNSQVHIQQKVIEELHQTISEVREALQSLRPSMIAAPDEETPPPHY